jgi:hypothetical protein
MPTLQERLDAIKAEFARQDQAWERIRNALANTRVRHVLVANELLAAIDATARPPAPRPAGVRA